MTTEQIRWIWVGLTAFGMFYAAGNLLEVRIDDRAVRQIRTRPVDLLRMQTSAEVWDMAFIFGGLAAHFIAGAFSVIQFSMGALVALIVGEVLFIATAVHKMRSRKRIFQALRVRPEVREQ